MAGGGGFRATRNPPGYATASLVALSFWFDQLVMICLVFAVIEVLQSPVSCSHRSALFLQHAYRCTFVSCSMDWSIWLHQQLCMQTHKLVPITFLVGQYPILKIVLSQASWQRVMVLPSRSALQPQLSFNLLCRCKPSTRHLFFLFQVYIACLLLPLDPLHII